MNDSRPFIKRLVLAGGLALGVLATATLGGSTAGADAPRPAPSRTPTPPPTNTGIIPPDLANRRISVGAVQVDGTQATLAFFTAQPAAATVTYKPVGGASAGGESPAQGYAHDHQRTLTGLAANTQYDVTITARTQSGETSTAQTSFTTAALVGGLTVQALGTEATVRFTTAEPASATLAYNPASGQGGGGQAKSGYGTMHELKLTGLTSNTAYQVTVTAETTGRTDTAKTSFTTAKKRVRVMLQSIDVKDDGDWIGDGEPVWYVKPIWDGRSFDGALCWPRNCLSPGQGEGRSTPRNAKGEYLTMVFAEENFDRFPSTFALQVWAKEDDLIGAPPIIECFANGGCPVGEDAEQVAWRLPQGVESASQYLTVRADDPATGFKSVLTFSIELTHNNAPYPTPFRNNPIQNWYASSPS